MRENADEFRLETLSLADLGNIVEKKHCRYKFSHWRMYLPDPGLKTSLALLFSPQFKNRGTLFSQLPPYFTKLKIIIRHGRKIHPHHFNDTVRAKADEFSHPLVYMSDPSLIVPCNHSIFNRREKRFQLVFLPENLFEIKLV